MSTESDLADKFKALGDPVRIKILNHLPNSANCEYGNNVSQLAGKLGVPQPTISHHLKVLRQAGLVTNRKMCRDVFYWIDPAASKKVQHLLDLVFGPLPPDPESEEPEN